MLLRVSNAGNALWNAGSIDAATAYSGPPYTADSAGTDTDNSDAVSTGDAGKTAWNAATSTDAGNSTGKTLGNNDAVGTAGWFSWF